MYAVFETGDFSKVSKKILSHAEQARYCAIKDQLRTEPFSGKPLGTPFLREKKLSGKRIYYVVYEQLGVVLVVGVSTKKAQKETIARIKLSLPGYAVLAEKFRQLS